METVYRVEWHYFNGCDEFTSTLDTFSTRSVAEEFVSNLETIALYVNDCHDTFDQLFDRFDPKGSKDKIVATLRARGVPEVVFHFQAQLAAHLGIDHIELPLPVDGKGGYNIYPDTVSDELPSFMT